jgi:hypothetical protein
VAVPDADSEYSEILATGTAFLPRYGSDNPAFGLTSYLLFGTEPTSRSDSLRYLALSAYD